MTVTRPPIKWVGSPHFTPGRRGHKPVALVYHIMDGSLAGTDAWFQDPSSRASSHFGIGRDGSIHQYVKEEDSAWANGRVREPSWPLIDLFPGVNPNDYTLSIEHEGKPGEEFSEAMYQASLALTRYLTEMWRIPPDRGHLVGHFSIDSVDRADCPGPSFPWNRLFRDLRSDTSGPFPDVPPDDPGADVIAWTREYGLFIGDGRGHFRPDDPVTRRELAFVLKRFHDLIERR